jgi:hypothetical protein
MSRDAHAQPVSIIEVLMKVSTARLNQARELRDAALSVLDHGGLDTILADRGKRYRTQQIEVGDLSVMLSRPAGEYLLDIWQGKKVFSVAWDMTGSLTVIALRAGGWQSTLRAIAEAEVATAMTV